MTAPAEHISKLKEHVFELIGCVGKLNALIAEKDKQIETLTTRVINLEKELELRTSPPSPPDLSGGQP